MKKLLYILITSSFSLLTSPFCFSQNLVPNPSFEQFDTCPNNYSQLYYATDWKSFGGSPEYYNQCDSTNFMSVPANDFGYQYASSGSGYAGLFTYETMFPNFREYIGIQLTQPLTIGQKYYVSFKANLTLEPNYFCCGTNKIGTLFSTIPYSASSPPPLNNYAHIYANNIISDTVNWTTVSDSFVADSNYNYLILGNFFDDTNTNYIVYNNGPNLEYAYYYIDDIYVSTDSTNSVSNFNNINAPLQLFPNPTTKNISINLPETQEQYVSLLIYNVHGVIMDAIPQFSNHSFINVSSYPNGTYFIQIKYSLDIVNAKFIKSSNQ